jgi:uncharacterized protein (AIM24 family)
MKRIACTTSIRRRPPPTTDHHWQHSFSSTLRRYCSHRHHAFIDRQFSSLPAARSDTTQPTTDNNSNNNESSSITTPELVPIDFTTSSTITGDESQILQVHLRPNQMLRAESGSMLYMTHGVNMETSMGLNNTGSGLSTGIARMLTGQNLMISDFTYSPPPPNNNSSSTDDNVGTVCLGTDFPAKILKLQLNHYPNSTLICQKGAYLAGSHSIIMEMAFTKSFTGGFFGGEGFVLQKLRSSGTDSEQHYYNDDTVFLKAYGTVVKKTLRPNETLRVSSGSLVGMTSDVDFDVTTLSGFKNVMFGGEGLFVTTLTGPGTVWLQGMPIDRMVSEIARRVPSGGGIGLGVPLFGGGGGGSGGEEGAATAEDAAVAGSTPNNETDATGVPLSDSTIEADRNATVASSGMMTDDSSSSDPESSESLFGDAAYGGDDPQNFGTSSTTSLEDNASFTMEDDFSQPSDGNMAEFEEPRMVDEQQFEDDGTTFSTDASEGDSEEAPTTSADEEGGQSIFGQIWDMFKDWDD